MSSYFDAYRSQILDLQKTARASEDSYTVEVAARVDELTKGFERDVSLCTEMPGFPADLRIWAAEVFLRYLPEPLPNVCRDYKDDYQIFDDLLAMEGEMHTLFHEVGRRNIPGFSDSPRSPINSAVCDAQDFRESLARRLAGLGYAWVVQAADKNQKNNTQESP